MEFKLVLKKINNTLTKEEETIFNEWYDESKNHRIYFEKVKKIYDGGPDTLDLDQDWKVIWGKINKKKRIAVWKYAAAAVVLIGLGSFLFLTMENKTVTVETPTVVQSKGPIEIGSDKATLTLEDGSDVFLQKGEDYEDGNLKSNGEQLVYDRETELKKKEIAYNYLTIPRGGQFFLELSDGTKVWLNSDSKLKYPVAFNENNSRKVELIYGEAYFDVSPSEEHNNTNFVVATEGQEVVVLGTEFNIKAYKEEEIIATTLVEGKVLVDNKVGETNLTPGYQSKFNKRTNVVNTSKINVYNEVSWKSGFFSFHEMPLDDIMTVLSRWYDIEVFFENDDTQNIKFNGVFSKKQSIEELLSIIENTNEITYKINGKAILMK